MAPPPDDGTAASTGPPDRQTLRLLERHLSSDSLIAETEFEPDGYEPRLLHAFLDTGAYPDPVTAARLELRWFATGDFSVHYIEAHEENDSWECRWDRHPNPHNTRLHFHQPPNAVETVDLSLSSTHPLEIYSVVLTAIEQRIQTLWDDR